MFLFFRRFFSFVDKGAEPSAACGRYSEAQHGQNNEKPNRVQVSTMFCPWRREKAAQKREAQKEGIGWASINLPFLKFFGPAPFLSRKGAKLSAACGRKSEAEHGQNNEKSNVVRISIMFCPWSRVLFTFPWDLWYNDLLLHHGGANHEKL